MVTINALLLILAFACFCFATIGVATRVNLVALGLALWVATFLTTGFSCGG